MQFNPIAKKILTWLFLLEAKAVLAKYKPKIVAITGSAGKTSTKHALYTILSRFASVRMNKIQGNAWGLTLSIIGGEPTPEFFVQLKNLWRGASLLLFSHSYPEWLILEIAVQKPGDGDDSIWLNPYAVIVTYFGELPAHIEFFKNIHRLIDEKLKILGNLKEGRVYINADDPNFEYIKSKLKSPFVTFGLAKGANVTGSNVQIIYENGFPAGLNFKVNLNGHSLPVTVRRALGKSHVYAFLASLALAAEEHLTMTDASLAAQDYEAPWGRLKLVAGLKNTLIIDDSYNSSPAALREALATLAGIEGKGRKVAVLGDMLELGRDTYSAHRKLGALTGQTANILITIGARAHGFTEGALGILSREKIFEFEDVRGAIEFLENLIEPGDIILIKGSRSLNLEKIVEEIKLHQGKALM